MKWWAGVGIVVAIGILNHWEVAMGEVPLYKGDVEVLDLWMWGIGRGVVPIVMLGLVVWGGWEIWQYRHRLILEERGRRLQRILQGIGWLGVVIGILFPIAIDWMYPIVPLRKMPADQRQIAEVWRGEDRIQILVGRWDSGRGLTVVRWERPLEGRIQMIPCVLEIGEIYWENRRLVVVDFQEGREYEFVFEDMGPERRSSILEWLRGIVWIDVE